MNTQIPLDQVASHLARIRSESGEETFRQALSQLGLQLATSPDGREFLSRLGEALEVTLDLEDLQAQAEALQGARGQGQPNEPQNLSSEDVQSAFVQALKQQMPNLKTQAQYDLASTLLQSVQQYLNAAFGRDEASAAAARKGIDMAMDLALKMGNLAEQLEDSPEATTNSDFIRPPKQFTEDATAQRLLEELEKITSLEALNTWYSRERDSLNGVLRPSLRNKVFDAIRSKKKQFT